MSSQGSDEKNLEIAKFILDNFECKECVRFMKPKPETKTETKPESNNGDKKPDPNSKCQCGESLSKHSSAKTINNNGSERNNTLSPIDWNKSRDIVKKKTNAFGEISFIPEGDGMRKPSKFLRLADDSDMSLVMELLKDHWKMLEPKKPSLVITVIGGAKNFKLDGRKKETFNRGLIKAAKSTNAWIITSGFNMGVMKAVGEAVSEGQTYDFDEKRGITHNLRCIGIAPWGYVERRKVLEPKKTGGFVHAQYLVSNQIHHGQPVSLNPNHTHFLLVDDGYRGKYQGVAEFRANLEKKISAEEFSKEGGIPVVLMVVEGGYDAIDDVSKSLESNIPVVVCEGTGRAADILAYAYIHSTASKNEKRNDKFTIIINQKIKEAFQETWLKKGDDFVKKEAEKFTKIVTECCKKNNLITVFDMNKHEDLDVAILASLLKGTSKEGTDKIPSLLKQLELALTWNRCDVAQEKIINQDIAWEEHLENLYKIMTKSLQEDKVDFVRLFLQNGVVLKDFLTEDKLDELYRNAPKQCAFNVLLNGNNKIFSGLEDIRKLIRSLIGKAGKGHCVAVECENEVEAAEKLEKDDKTNKKFPFFYKELFLWAILLNRQSMAKFLWERADKPIATALAASWLYGKMAEKAPHYESSLIESLSKNKDEFEHLALTVLEECHREDSKKADDLLKRRNSMWGNMNCLEMAAEARDRAFLSTVCCQNSLNEMWKRKVQSHWLRVLIALLFPPFILSIKFKHGDDDCMTNDTTNSEGSIDSVNAKHNGARATEKKSRCSSFKWENVIDFYTAPITKFSANLVMFVLFLILYSYMLLFSFNETISTIEWVVLGWMTTLFLDELREMFSATTADKMSEKLEEWWAFSIFNRMDLLMFILAILGFILRWIPGVFFGSKVVYCMNCIVIFVSFLRFYSATSYLGPKLLMMTKMLRELFFFLLIFLVILLAYGVSTQSMMYLHREPYALIFRDIFYYSYWQLFGQLYVEDMQGENCQSPNGTISSGEPCPDEDTTWVVLILTALYLLIANILLLNILIAIFNHVFEEIQANSIQIWKYGMYFLVVEYETKPSLAPPFVIIEHIYMVLRWVYRKVACKQTVEASDDNGTNKDDMLNALEKECRKNCLQKMRMLEDDNSQKKIKFIESRVDEVAKMMEEDRLLNEQAYGEQEGMGSQQGTPRRRSRQISTSSFTHVPNPTSATNNNLDTTSLATKTMNIDKVEELMTATPDSGNVSQESQESGMLRLGISSLQTNSTKQPFIQGTNTFKESELDSYDGKLFTSHLDSDFKKDNQPVIIINTASDDDEFSKEAQSEKRHRKKRGAAKSKKQKNVEGISYKNNLDVSSTKPIFLRKLSWEKRIFSDEDDVISINDDNVFINSSMKTEDYMTTGQTKNLIHVQSVETNKLETVENDRSIIPSSNPIPMEDRMTSLEKQLIHLEQSTRTSLCNIEALLRNMVSSQDISQK